MYELPPFEKTFHPLQHNKYLMRRRDVMGRYYSSQAYYQSCANKHLETEQRKIMMEKLTSPFTWKQFFFEIFLIGWLPHPTQSMSFSFLHPYIPTGIIK